MKFRTANTSYVIPQEREEDEEEEEERDFLITMREHPEGIGMGEEDISVGTLTPPVNPAEPEGTERAAEGPDAPPTKTSCNPPEPVALA